MSDQNQMTPILRNAVIIAVLVAVSVAFGRWSAPEKVKIETKIVEVEKKKTDTDTHKDTKTVVTEKPDGSKETVVTVVENTKTHEVDNTKTKSDTVKEVTRSGQRTNISFLLGAQGTLNTTVSFINNPIYGVSVSREIIGPVTVGLWANTAKTGGFSIGLNF